MVYEMNKLSEWLAKEMQTRGLSMRELARKADISHTTVADVISGQRSPTCEFCLAIARALDERPERILYLASYLPSEPSIADLDITPVELQILNLVREVEGKEPLTKPAVVVYFAQGQTTNDLITEICARQPNLDLRFLEEARGKISEEHLRLLLQNILAAARGDEEETRTFIELHRQVSHTLSTKLLGEKDEGN
jgi:transcriptional regulator with XRE-family HTH domain